MFDGDYVRSGNAVRELSGTDEMLERVAFRLRAKKGGFALLPELGSRLYELSRIKRSERRLAAEQFIRQALEDEPDVELKAVEVEEEDGVIRIDVEIAWDGIKHKMRMEV